MIRRDELPARRYRGCLWRGQVLAVQRLVRTRINSDPASFQYLVDALSNGEAIFYTSDGNSDTVKVPNPIPEYLANEFDPKAITADGKTVVRYDRAGGPTPTPSASSSGRPVAGSSPVATRLLEEGGTATTTDTGVRMRDAPGTNGDVVEELEIGTIVTILAAQKRWTAMPGGRWRDRGWDAGLDYGRLSSGRILNHQSAIPAKEHCLRLVIKYGECCDDGTLPPPGSGILAVMEPR